MTCSKRLVDLHFKLSCHSLYYSASIFPCSRVCVLFFSPATWRPVSCRSNHLVPYSRIQKGTHPPSLCTHYLCVMTKLLYTRTIVKDCSFIW